MKVIYLILVASLLSFGCATPQYVYEGLESFELEDARREIYSSRLDLRSTQPITDAEAKNRLAIIYSKLAFNARKICSEIGESDNCKDWMVKFIDDDQINAYATIIDNKETIAFTKNLISTTVEEDELAMVMAHELAHHQLRHLYESSNRALGGSILGAVIGGAIAVAVGDIDLVDPIMDVSSEIGGTVASLKYSSEQEKEADSIAMRILVSSGFNFEKAKKYMLITVAGSNSAEMATPYLATHPVGPERIAHLNQVYKSSYIQNLISKNPQQSMSEETIEFEEEDLALIKKREQVDCSAFLKDQEKLTDCLRKTRD